MTKRDILYKKLISEKYKVPNMNVIYEQMIDMTSMYKNSIQDIIKENVKYQMENELIKNDV